MKKLFIIISVLLAFSACTKLEDLNVNTKDFALVSGESTLQWSYPPVYKSAVHRGRKS